MAGSATTIGSWALSQFGGVTMDPGIEGAFVVLIAGLMSYWIPNADPPDLARYKNE